MKKLKSVLLVDDDTICSFLNQRILEELQLVEQVVSLQDAQAALAYLARVTPAAGQGEEPCPDVIFLDVNMPELNGFDFLDGLAQIESCQHLARRVVMLSTSSHELDISRANGYHIHSYLIKPLTESTALQIIQGFLAEQQVQAEETLQENARHMHNGSVLGTTEEEEDAGKVS